jgi:hypothetical protein
MSLMFLIFVAGIVGFGGLAALVVFLVVWLTGRKDSDRDRRE